MSEPRYACGRCGTWTCSACGGQRANTDVRYVDYPCSRCRGRTGTLVPTMHTAKMWAKHNEGPLPTAYPYGERPLAKEWGPGFGSRDVPQPHYRGVPVPNVPWLDMESFRRGVDAALGWAADAVVQETRNATGASGVWDLLNRHAAKLAVHLRTRKDGAS